MGEGVLFEDICGYFFFFFFFFGGGGGGGGGYQYV